jgi:hypothetical protein
MKTAHFEHRCRRCGEVFPTCAADYDVDKIKSEVREATAEFRWTLEFHDCLDGGYGVADLIGARVEESE